MTTLHNDYSYWIRRYDTLRNNDRKKMLDQIQRFKYRPFFSIIMPVFETPINLLEEAINSVQSQIYPDWELCIADDASQDPAIYEMLKKYSNNDKRIKVVFRAVNGHISKASNSALKLASGEYVALLDHDDVLSEHALFWIANEINDNPNVKLIYSDEDKINEQGQRSDAYFKCDWNLDLFLSHNMFCHLGVYDTELIKKIGGFRVGYEGAQDYDLVLRCLDYVDEKQIKHIPRILYHWRLLPGSTSLGSEEKDYAIPAGKRAIQDYLHRKSKPAGVKYVNPGYRVKYNVPEPCPLVSLIIPTRDKVNLLQQCISSIINKNCYSNYEIIIVDNDSKTPETRSYLEMIQKEQKVRVIRDERPFNYSALNNLAVESASGEIIGLINNDIEAITPEWMQEMISHACRPEVGAVGARLLYSDRTIQHAGVIMGIAGVAGHAHKNLPCEQSGYFGRAALLQSFSAVTGACLFVRKKLYKEAGGLNEANLSIAFNDIDFCLKLREKGYHNIWTPYAELYHHESMSRGTDDTPEQIKRFEKEFLYMKQHWGDIISSDPAYSPNLTLEYEDFSLASPPRVPSL